MKKGQVTMFVVLGILIFAGIGIYIFYSKIPSMAQGAKDITSLSPQFSEAGKQIEDCLDIVLNDGAVSAGLKGGYTDNSELKKYDYAGLDVTYLYYDGQSHLPAKEEVEKALGSYLKENALQCAGTGGDIIITPGSVKSASVFIKDTVVDAEVEWDITFRKGDFVSKAGLFRASAPLKMGKIMDEVTGFMAVQVQKPNEICLSCLIDSAEKNNFKIEIDNMITTYVFSITDKSEGGFDFVFANGY
ncbi:MAG: hypothetical protein PHO02_06885 [Candidatus Nanoarchaeia archaeon]|nr:hypothetical protein [Candidatus Nanoarchaeia archaeon]